LILQLTSLLLFQLPGLIAQLEATELSNPEFQATIEEVFLTELKVRSVPTRSLSLGKTQLISLSFDTNQEYSEALVGLQDLVEQTIDLDEMSSHNYVIKPDFDEDLQKIKEQLIEARDGLDDEHQRVGRVLELDTEKKLHLENQQVYGYCLRITKAVSSSSVRIDGGGEEDGLEEERTQKLTRRVFLVPDHTGSLVDPREEGFPRAWNSEGWNLLHYHADEGAFVQLRRISEEVRDDSGKFGQGGCRDRW